MPPRIKTNLGWYLLAVEIVALWPNWRWYTMRIHDGSDEPWGILALFSVVYMVFRERNNFSADAPKLLLPNLLFVVYLASYPWAPPLVRAAVGVTIIGYTLSQCLGNRTMNLALLGLLGLSLPIISSLQFYLGYPLRLICTQLTAPLLQLGGVFVVAQGAVLHRDEQMVVFDAPCSGIHMLWTGAYLVCILSFLYRLSNRQTSLAFAFALLIIIAANVLRGASLFYLEVYPRLLPSWGHIAVGMIVFAIAVVGIERMIYQIRIYKRPCAQLFSI